MLRKYFPHILLTPDDNSSSAGSSPVVEGSATQQTQEPGANEPDPFDAAAQAAIETVQAATSPDANAVDDNDKATNGLGAIIDPKGEIKSLTPTDGELNEDGSPKAAKPDSAVQETVEQKAAREAKELLAKTKPVITDKPDDAKLPFHKHARFQEVLAERDTFRNDAAQYKQQYDTVKPLVERQQSIEAFCQQNQIPADAFQELLQIRALMNTDPAQALEKILPVVESLKAIAGKGIAPDLMKKVTDGLIDEDSAKEITKLRAQTQHRDFTQRSQQEQQQRQVVQQMEQSVTSWFATKKTADPAFASKEILLNGQFKVILDQAPPKSVADVTAALEKAYSIVNEQVLAFAPKPKVIKAPLGSNTSRAVPKEPISLDDFATQAIDRLLAVN